MARVHPATSPPSECVVGSYMRRKLLYSNGVTILTCSVDWKHVLIISILVYVTFSLQMLTYFAAFEVFFEENLPKLFAHFKKNNLTPDIYLIDW